MIQSNAKVDPLRECRLAIGDLCYSLVFNDTFFAKIFRMHYDGFLLNDVEPDITVELDIIYHPPDVYQTPDSFLVTKIVNGNHFYFGSLLEGSLYLSEKCCRITVKEILLKRTGIRLFEKVLFQIYHTLLDNQNPRPISSFVHASGVACDSVGFVFSGPSGSGKSTIASLSTYQGIVLNDECIIIEKREHDFCVRGTPFSGNFRGKKNIKVPLKAVFLLEHAKENSIKPIKKSEFARRFVRELVFSVPLLSTNNKSAFSDMLDFCSKLAEEVPTYQLSFRPDRSFWKCIQEENLL